MSLVSAMLYNPAANPSYTPKDTAAENKADKPNDRVVSASDASDASGNNSQRPSTALNASIYRPQQPQARPESLEQSTPGPADSAAPRPEEIVRGPVGAPEKPLTATVSSYSPRQGLIEAEDKAVFQQDNPLNNDQLDQDNRDFLALVDQMRQLSDTPQGYSSRIDL